MTLETHDNNCSESFLKQIFRHFCVHQNILRFIYILSLTSWYARGLKINSAVKKLVQNAAAGVNGMCVVQKESFRGKFEIIFCK